MAALYAHEVWDASPENVDAFVVSLSEGKSQRVDIHEEALVETVLRIQEDTAMVQDIVSRAGADPLTFPKTSNVSQCPRCNYQRICHPEGVSF